MCGEDRDGRQLIKNRGPCRFVSSGEEKPRQFHKLFRAEFFGAAMCPMPRHRFVPFGGNDGQAVSQRLSSLVECRANDRTDSVDGKALPDVRIERVQGNDSAFHLRAGIEYRRRDAKEQLHPGLQAAHHTQSPVGLGSGRGHEPLGNLQLHHEHSPAYRSRCVEQGKEDGRRDVIRKVADDVETAGRPFGEFPPIQFEHITVEHMQVGEGRPKDFYGALVHFHGP